MSALYRSTEGFQNPYIPHNIYQLFFRLAITNVSIVCFYSIKMNHGAIYLKWAISCIQIRPIYTILNLKFLLIEDL